MYQWVVSGVNGKVEVGKSCKIDSKDSDGSTIGKIKNPFSVAGKQKMKTNKISVFVLKVNRYLRFISGFSAFPWTYRKPKIKLEVQNSKFKK